MKSFREAQTQGVEGKQEGFLPWNPDMEQNELHFLPGQDIGESSFFLRFDEFKGFPVGVFEDVNSRRSGRR